MLDLGLDLNVWPWVWLGIALFFAAIELTFLAGSFVILPFAVSAFAAALLGFYNHPIELQWAAFLGLGAVLWYLMYRYLRKFTGENEIAPGVGADRLVGLTGIVTAAISPDDTDRRGRVTTQGEVWGALSAHGGPIEAGAHVRILEVAGTRVIVEPIDPGEPVNPGPINPGGS